MAKRKAAKKPAKKPGKMLRGLLRQLAQVVIMAYGRKPGHRFHSFYDLLLEYGQYFEPGPLPPGIRKGRPKDCYANAYKISGPEQFGGKGLVYCEGMALTQFSDGTSHEFEHAWCVDPKTGTVIDPTLQAAEYFGIPFDSKYVSKTIARKDTYSVFIGNGEVFKKGLPKLALHRLSRLKAKA